MSDGIWVDHCKFSDGTCNDMIRNYNHDGAFDIKHGKNITVSWIYFTNHDKVMLVGSNDTDYKTASDRQITLHHIYFYKTTQRMPRTRGTQMHIYNCYYANIGVSGNSGECMGPGVGAEFIVENNYFDTGTFYQWNNNSSGTKVVGYYESAGQAKAFFTGNNYNPDNHNTSSRPWTPAYSFTLESASNAKTSVTASDGAGPTLVFKN